MVHDDRANSDRRRQGAGVLDGYDRRWIQGLPHITGKGRNGVPLTKMTIKQRCRELTRDCGLPPIGKSEAVAYGLKFYGPSVHCRHGHLDIRTTAGGCLACIQERAKARQATPEHQAKERERHRQRRAIEELTKYDISW